MLNSLCGPNMLPPPQPPPSHTPIAPRPVEKKLPPSACASSEPKPINLTRHQQPTYDPDLLFPPAATKGQFVCPNCGQDFLNRDALAMHMMESVHSEACASSEGGGSKDDRLKKSSGCHHTKLSPAQPTTAITPRPLSPPRRYFRIPNIASNNVAPVGFQSLLQSFMKTKPQVDTSLPRPGRKPRRLVPSATDITRPLQIGVVSKVNATPKRPKSCEPEVGGGSSKENLPDRASSTPGGGIGHLSPGSLLLTPSPVMQNPLCHHRKPDEGRIPIKVG